MSETNRENEIIHVVGFGLMERHQAEDCINGELSCIDTKDPHTVKAFEDAIKGAPFIPEGGTK